MALTSVIEAELAKKPPLAEALAKATEIYLYIPPGGNVYRLHIYINRGTSINVIGKNPDFDLLVPNPTLHGKTTGLAFYNQGQVEHHLRQVEATALEEIVAPTVAILGGHSQQDYKDLRDKTSFYRPRS